MPNREKSKSWQYLYSLSAWRKGRISFINKNPLCEYCMQVDRVTAAEVVDHKIPHKGNLELFLDVSNWRTLCKQCHDSAKAIEESKGYAPGSKADGMPVDPNNPFYKER